MKNKIKRWAIVRIKLYLKLKYIEDLKNLFKTFKKFINNIKKNFE